MRLTTTAIVLVLALSWATSAPAPCSLKTNTDILDQRWTPPTDEARMDTRLGAGNCIERDHGAHGPP